jgi:hypothetical protein
MKANGFESGRDELVYLASVMRRVWSCWLGRVGLVARRRRVSEFSPQRDDFDEVCVYQVWVDSALLLQQFCKFLGRVKLVDDRLE